MVILIESMPPNLMLLAGMTRLELANQLIENQPAFHFAFIPGGIGSLIHWLIELNESLSELVPAEGFEPPRSGF